MYRTEILADKLRKSPINLSPICIASYSRPDAILLNELKQNDIYKGSLLFVRKEEYEIYEKWSDFFKIIRLNNVDNIGDTRRLVVNYCIKHGIEDVYLLDDDINEVQYLIPSETSGGVECMRTYSVVKQVKKAVDPIAFMMWQYLVENKCKKGDRLRKDCKKENFPYQILKKGVPLYSTSIKEFRLVFSPPINTDAGKIGVVRKLCNHCGSAGPLEPKYNNKKCTRPFREMAFRHDGSVAICCNDYRGEYPIGNINDYSAEELWNHKRFQAARIMLYSGDRDFRPCYGCNAVSTRVGLLPDPLGKKTLPNVTEKIKIYCQNISKNNEPLCGENWHKRPWEE